MAVYFRSSSRQIEGLDLACSSPLTRKSSPESRTYAVLGIDDPKIKECGICLDGISLDARVKSLYCKHQFHRDCIDPWLQAKGSCPTCRDDVALNAPHLIPSLKAPIAIKSDLFTAQDYGNFLLLAGTVTAGLVNGRGLVGKTASVAAAFLAMSASSHLTVNINKRLGNSSVDPSGYALPIYSGLGMALGTAYGKPAFESAATGAMGYILQRAGTKLASMAGFSLFRS